MIATCAHTHICSHEGKGGKKIRINLILTFKKDSLMKSCSIILKSMKSSSVTSLIHYKYIYI